MKIVRGTFIALLVLTLVSCELFPFQGDGNGDSDGDGIPDHQELLLLANLGRGYNIFGNYADPREVQSAVLDSSRLRSAGVIEERPVESATFQTYSGTTVTEYSSNIATHVGVSGSYRVFSGSIDTNFSAESYSSGEYSYATLQSQIYKTQLSLSTTDAQSLRDYLTQKAAEDIDDPEVAPDTLFERYGTHVISGFFAGGRVDYSMSFDMSSVSSSKSLSVMASASFKSLFASASIQADQVSESERSQYESHSQTTLNVYGGESELGQNIIGDNDYQAWIDTVAGNPQLVGFPSSSGSGSKGLIGLWEFAATPERRQEIEEAFMELASSLDLPVNNSLKVEVTLSRIDMIKFEDAGSEAEFYGQGGFDLYNDGGDLAALGEWLWWVPEDRADDWGTIENTPAYRYLWIQKTAIKTFPVFDESRSHVSLWGSLWEDDSSGDEFLGNNYNNVYLRDGWNGHTEHSIFFKAGGLEANMIFTIKVVK